MTFTEAQQITERISWLVWQYWHGQDDVGDNGGNASHIRENDSHIVKDAKESGGK